MLMEAKISLLTAMAIKSKECEKCCFGLFYFIGLLGKDFITNLILTLLILFCLWLVKVFLTPLKVNQKNKKIK